MPILPFVNKVVLESSYDEVKFSSVGSWFAYFFRILFRQKLYPQVEKLGNLTEGPK